MSVLRPLIILIACASLSRGATPEATVSARQYKSGEARTCELAIVAVDGHRLKSPRTQVRFPPGRHSLTVHVTFLWAFPGQKPKVEEADAPLVQMLEAHHYSIEGKLSSTGALKLHVQDETKKSEESRTPKRNP
jgi:hypothetical protein